MRTRFGVPVKITPDFYRHGGTRIDVDGHEMKEVGIIDVRFDPNELTKVTVHLLPSLEPIVIPHADVWMQLLVPDGFILVEVQDGDRRLYHLEPKR